MVEKTYEQMCLDWMCERWLWLMAANKFGVIQACHIHEIAHDVAMQLSHNQSGLGKYISELSNGYADLTAVREILWSWTDMAYNLCQRVQDVQGEQPLGWEVTGVSKRTLTCCSAWLENFRSGCLSGRLTLVAFCRLAIDVVDAVERYCDVTSTGNEDIDSLVALFKRHCSETASKLNEVADRLSAPPADLEMGDSPERRKTQREKFVARVNDNPCLHSYIHFLFDPAFDNEKNYECLNMARLEEIMQSCDIIETKCEIAWDENIPMYEEDTIFEEAMRLIEKEDARS